MLSNAVLNLENLSESFSQDLNANMNQCGIRKMPVELLLMIIKKLRFFDAFYLCEALKISHELSFQYHSYDGEVCSIYTGFIYGLKNCKIDRKIENRKIENPHLAEALIKNVKFQSFAKPNDKVKYAMLTGDLELVKKALESPGVDHDDIYSSPLGIAAYFGLLDFLMLLVNDYGVDISAGDNEALHLASEWGDIDMIEYILSLSNFNLVNCSEALATATIYERTDAVRYILYDLKVDPSYNENEALMYAAENGNVELLMLLLADPRVDPSDQNYRAIRDAAKNKHTNILKLLLADERINVESLDERAINDLVRRVIEIYHH